MISSAKTLGVFQIESPGQRELVGKSGIETFDDIITDISLFRPGPVKSDMITPYLEVKQGWKTAHYLHDDLRPILEQTRGVVVFHEQVIEMIAQFGGVSYAEGDEKRRALGDTDGMAETRAWFFPRALAQGYDLPLVEQVWKVLEAFASFGFCKAHAAAFALPTYQSAWLKAHWPAHFLSGVLTHDPGMYPKRLILDDARQFGVGVLGLDVNASASSYVVERGDAASEGHAIRLSLTDVKGISGAEVARIVEARDGAPYVSLSDFFHRARVSRPVLERLVLAGGFDAVYGIGSGDQAVHRRGRVTRRDLLLQVAELDLHARAIDRASRARGRGLSSRRTPLPATVAATEAADRNSSDPDRPGGRRADRAARPGRRGCVGPRGRPVAGRPPGDRGRLGAAHAAAGRRAGRAGGATHRAARDDHARADARRAGDPRPRRQPARRRRLRPVPRRARRDPQPRPAAPPQPRRAAGRGGQGRHPDAADQVRSAGGVPDPRRRHRSGRRDLLRGRPGPLRRDGLLVVAAAGARRAAAHRTPRVSRCAPPAPGSCRPCTSCGSAAAPARRGSSWCAPSWPGCPRPVGEEPTQRRVLVHTSGFQMSPYSDIKPAGDPAKDVARKLWHRSPGSPG